MAPLALIAYPEALLKSSAGLSLLLVVNEGDGLFGCTDELWLKQTTTLVAGMFSRTIRQAAGRSDMGIPHTPPFTERHHKASGPPVHPS